MCQLGNRFTIHLSIIVKIYNFSSKIFKFLTKLCNIPSIIKGYKRYYILLEEGEKMSQQAAAVGSHGKKQESTAYKILFIIGLCHLLNDSLQSVVPAMFPILEKSMGLSFTQLGMVAFSLNIVAALLQPVFGMFSDKKPRPYTLPLALSFTLLGVLGLAFAPSFELVLLSVALMGLGSSIFHPEGSKVAFMASGPRRGLAQSIYQVGGNTGQALAPLITAAVLVPLGQRGASWFVIVAAAAVGLLTYISKWYAAKLRTGNRLIKAKTGAAVQSGNTVPKAVWVSLFLVLFFIFARSWYVSGMTNYYAFYAIETVCLFHKKGSSFFIRIFSSRCNRNFFWRAFG